MWYSRYIYSAQYISTQNISEIVLSIGERITSNVLKDVFHFAWPRHVTADRWTVRKTACTYNLHDLVKPRHRTQVLSSQEASPVYIWEFPSWTWVSHHPLAAPFRQKIVFSPFNIGSPNGLAAHRLRQVQLALDTNPIHATDCIRIPGMWRDDQLNLNRRGRCWAPLLLGIVGCWTKRLLQVMLEDGDMMTKYKHYLHYLQNPH